MLYWNIITADVLVGVERAWSACAHGRLLRLEGGGGAVGWCAVQRLRRLILTGGALLHGMVSITAELLEAVGVVWMVLGPLLDPVSALQFFLYSRML